VAFTFAAMDVVLEADGKGIVRYAAGSPEVFGEAVESLVGRAIADLFDPQDAALISGMLGALPDAGRFRDLRVRARRGGMLLDLAACRIPEGQGRLHIAIRHASARTELVPALPTPTLLPDAAFVRRGSLLAESGVSAAMTLFAVEGAAAAARATMGEDAWERVTAAVARYLHAYALDEGVGDLGDGRYGLLHGPGIDIASTARGLEAVMGRLTGRPLVARASTTDITRGAMPRADAARAVAWAVARFLEGRRTPGNLQGSLAEMIREGAGRIGMLRTTIRRRLFEVALQPIVCLSDRRVWAMEVLCRLPEGAGGTQDAIGFAEETGLVAELDLAILERVVEIGGQQDGLLPPLAVNLSGRSLEAATFWSAATRLLDGFRGPASAISFELTETARVEAASVATVRARLEELRARGHRVALDDFGAGASGLEYLQAFPCDTVKIDGAYVDPIVDDARARDLLRGIVGMIRGLGASTTAERVETEAQAAILHEIGVANGQGWLFGRPALLASRAAL
jgi:EAL domain-containing protein (putative c-di-GMP-specific phosphodiesterase class I)